MERESQLAKLLEGGDVGCAYVYDDDSYSEYLFHGSPEIIANFIVTRCLAYEGTSYREDYVHITLTDKEDIPDAVRKLRIICPCLMKLDYDKKRTRAGMTESRPCSAPPMPTRRRPPRWSWSRNWRAGRRPCRIPSTEGCGIEKK